MRYKMIVYIGIIAVALICFGARSYVVFAKENTVTVSVPQSVAPVTNPLKGFAAWGENYRKDPWVSFAYVPVYWSELEPEEGKYDFKALEERCHFEQWKQDGVRLIFRVVSDSPSSETHMDIPQWLYEKMNGAGDWYDNSYGKGFSPDYRNRIFKEAHTRLIQALAAQYGQNPQVAFWQLGSLGHWGEWHVNESAGIERFPFQTVTDSYVRDYLNCIDASKLLLRRPYEIGANSQMGLYNDSFGQKSHEMWLSWIADGYISDQNGEELTGMPDFWRYAPSGGEFATSQEENWYFSDVQFPVTLDFLHRSHTTFLGPNAPKYEDCNDETAKKIEVLLQQMGYSLGIRQCTLTNLRRPGNIEGTLIWENTGIAPMYENWPVRLELKNADGDIIWSKEYESRLMDWGPGTHTWTVMLDGTGGIPHGSYRLYAGIIDPLTQTPGVALTMTGDGCMYEIWSGEIF